MQILQSVGYTGMQHDAGNLWEGSNSMAALGSISASLALQNQFKIDLSIPGSKPALVTPPSIEEFWFVGDGIHPTCESIPDCNLPLFYYKNEDPNLIDINPDPHDPTIIIVDPAKPICEIVIELYSRLDKVDSITNPLEYWYLVMTINKWKLWKGPPG